MIDKKFSKYYIAKWSILITFSLSCAFMASCAPVVISTPLWMNATSIDMTAYENSRVGVLPTVFHPQLKPNPELSRILQKEMAYLAIFLDLYDTEIVEYTSIDPLLLSYPLTPDKLSRIGASLGFDAVLSSTITSYRHADRLNPASITVTIDFVDVTNPINRWNMFRKWQGKETYISANSIISQGLMNDFSQARRLLINKETEGLDRQTKIVTDNPNITISSPRNEFETEKTNIEVEIFVADSHGIENITIKNKRNRFDETIFNAKEIGYNLNYISLSRKIPLTLGANEITVISENVNGKKSARILKIFQTAAKERIWVLTIDVKDYLNDWYQLSGDHRGRVVSEFFSQMKEQDKVRLISLLDSQATLREIRKSLDFIRRNSGRQDVIIIYFSGKIKLDPPNILILPYDAEPDFLKATTIDADELGGLGDDFMMLFSEIMSGSSAKFYNSLTIVDACVDNIMEQFINLRLMDFKNDRLVVGLSSCNSETINLGRILVEGLTGAADQDRNKTITIRELKNFFKQKHQMVKQKSKARMSDVPIWKLEPKSGTNIE